MRANVYALFEVRYPDVHHWMVAATRQEAIDYYREVTGRPGIVTTDGVDDQGRAMLLIDEDASGNAAILEYSVGIQEITEE